MKDLFSKHRLSSLFISVISLILATCALGASAFSGSFTSKSFFRYYSNDERYGIRFAANTRVGNNDPTKTTTQHQQPLFLYKDNSRHSEGLPPFYSSVVDNTSWTSAPPLKNDSMNKYTTRKKKNDFFHVSKIVHGVTNAISVVTDVVAETIARGPPRVKKAAEADYQGNEQTQVVTLVDINWLKAHEDIVSEERVRKLYEATIGWNAYRLPLLVDIRSGAILDGHHRYAVGRVLGLSRLPAILVDYLNDDSISVDVWPECGVDCLTKQDVIEMSLSDEVFPPKTSKHDFVSSFAPINIPLSKLL